MVPELLQDIADTMEAALGTMKDALPADFPAAIVESVTNAMRSRRDRLRLAA